MSETQMLVRVKRRRDEDPIPELRIEAPAKRNRPTASAAALRLVDSVSSAQWDFSEGIPASWLHAAASAEWGAQAPLSQPPRQVNADEMLLQESRRQMVAAAFGETVQLIDVDRVSMEPEAAAPQQIPSSIFTIDGQPLVAVSSDASASCSSGYPSNRNSDDMFVWDVYAMSDDTRNQDMSCLSAVVRLMGP